MTRWTDAPTPTSSVWVAGLAAVTFAVLFVAVTLTLSRPDPFEGVPQLAVDAGVLLGGATSP